ncbi:hypothetical protein F8156_21260 [Bacillus cereus]|nr:hypothetical protein [Bacillus cereus]KAB2500247.1 hypothetical protein F8156_21260 [Bacillus cereus]
MSPTSIRYTLLAISFYNRHAEIIDYLADLLNEIMLKFGNKAKNTTRNKTVVELEKVPGKNKHIINLLKATVYYRSWMIQDTLFSIVSSLGYYQWYVEKKTLKMWVQVAVLTA